MTSPITQLRYSPRPSSAYQRYLHDKKIYIGVGQLRSVAASPALWNLLWLSDPTVDRVLDETVPDLKIPLTPPSLEAAQETVHQTVDGDRISTLVTMLRPHEFIDRIWPHRHSLALFQQFGEDWILTMKRRALAWQNERPATPVLVRQNVQTTPKPSANIIDLRAWRPTTRH